MEGRAYQRYSLGRLLGQAARKRRYCSDDLMFEVILVHGSGVLMTHETRGSGMGRTLKLSIVG